MLLNILWKMLQKIWAFEKFRNEIIKLKKWRDKSKRNKHETYLFALSFLSLWIFYFSNTDAFITLKWAEVRRQYIFVLFLLTDMQMNQTKPVFSITSLAYFDHWLSVWFQRSIEAVRNNKVEKSSESCTEKLLKGLLWRQETFTMQISDVTKPMIKYLLFFFNLLFLVRNDSLYEMTISERIKRN
jgi:hypothetical protein